MQFKLINGVYPRSEALEILSRMIEVKISFHEAKLAELTDEEEIMEKKSRIEALRHDLDELTNSFQQKPMEKVAISANVRY